MIDIVAQLKSLRLHGMAQRYEELQAEGGVGIQGAAWLIKCLLESKSPIGMCVLSATRWARRDSRCIAIWRASTSANRGSRSD